MKKIIITTIFTLLILTGLQINVDAGPNTKCVTAICNNPWRINNPTEIYHFIIPSQCKLIYWYKQSPSVYTCHYYEPTNKIYWDKNPYGDCDLSNEPFWVWQKDMPKQVEKCQ